MKLNITALGIASGVVAAILVAVFTFFAAIWGVGLELAMFLETANPGYSLSIQGALIGMVWEFSLGFIIATFFAWFYNLLAAPKIKE